MVLFVRYYRLTSRHHTEEKKRAKNSTVLFSEVDLFFPNMIMKKKMQLDVEVSPPAFGWYHQWHYAWKIKFHNPRCNGLVIYEFVSSYRQTYIHTESNAYEPTVHTHRWAQKRLSSSLFFFSVQICNYRPQGLAVVHIKLSNKCDPPPQLAKGCMYYFRAVGGLCMVRFSQIFWMIFTPGCSIIIIIIDEQDQSRSSLTIS